MAKKQSKVKPFISRINPEFMTRKDLFALNKGLNSEKYDHADSDLITPFGTIKMRECNIVDLEYGDDVPLVYDSDSITEAIDAGDWLESVVLLEKMIEKHPASVIFYFQLAESYDMLKEFDKSESVADRNYTLNKGMPLVDLNYMSLGSKKGTHDYLMFYDENFYNIHNAYSKRKYFHPRELVDYYCHLGECALNNKNIPLAKQFSAIAQEVDPHPKKVRVLKMMISHRQNPIKTKLKIASVIIIILSIIGLILWGIYRFFTWIF